jgi:alcohol dehydrogenase
MKGICFQDIKRVEWTDLPDPRIENSRDAIVKVELAGLCGSDLHPYFGREIGLDSGTVMGHEMVGTVVELGEAALQDGRIKVGDRVCAPFTTNCGQCFYCRQGLTARCLESQLFGWRSQQTGLHGCQAEFLRVPLASSTLLKIPATISDEQALLLGDNLSTAFYCAEMADIQPDGVYVVVGCGTVGQLCLQIVSQRGCRKLFAVDPQPERRNQGARWGAIPLEPEPEAISAIQRATSGRGADGVMELVGLPAAQQFAFQALRPGGTMSVIGCHCTPHFAFSPVDAYDKNLTYRTGRCSARYYMDQLQTAVEQQIYDLAGMITHQFEPGDCQRAYDIFSQQKEGCIKAAIQFG